MARISKTIAIIALLSLKGSALAIPRTIRCPRSMVLRLVQAAVEQASAKAGKLASWRQRLRWRALLPKISAGLSRSTGSAEVYDINAARPVPIDFNNRVALRWEVRATWDLTKLIFDGKELRATAVALAIAERRRRAQRRVIALYYQWVAMGARVETPRRQRVEILLDLASKGAFSLLKKQCR